MEPSQRVCPECGELAGEQTFCASCGRNLTNIDRLPSRAEWEANQPSPEREAPPGQGSSISVESRGDPRGARHGWNVKLLVGALVCLGVAVLAVALATSGGGDSGGRASATSTGSSSDQSEALASAFDRLFPEYESAVGAYAQSYNGTTCTKQDDGNYRCEHSVDVQGVTDPAGPLEFIFKLDGQGCWTPVGGADYPSSDGRSPDSGGCLEPSSQPSAETSDSTASPSSPDNTTTATGADDSSSGSVTPGSAAASASCGPASRVANRTLSSVVAHGEISCEIALSAIKTWLELGRPSGRFDRRGGPDGAEFDWICDYDAASGGNCSVASTLWATFRLSRTQTRKSCGTVTSKYGRSKVIIAAGNISCADALRLASDYVNYRNVVGPNSSQTVHGWAVIPGRNGEPTEIFKGKAKITVG